MKECASPTPLIVMTIGHSTRPAKEFIHLLKAIHVRALTLTPWGKLNGTQVTYPAEHKA